MKRVLIAGANSYIGMALEEYLLGFFEEFQTQTVDMRTDDWKKIDLSAFDAVVFVAGIVHRKASKTDPSLYFRVNRDLALETAERAKESGVGLFIYMSSMSVYGVNVGRITRDTPCLAKDAYGKSKLAAEEALSALADAHFAVSCIRPPMVYGKNCRGNYPRLAKFAQKLPFFPSYENERSMIYIENLSAYLKLRLDAPETGIFFPQNAAYVKTCELVRLIAACQNKAMRLTCVFDPLIGLLLKKVGVVQKVFGTLVYDMSLSGDVCAYNICDFVQSVRRSQNAEQNAENSGK